MLVIDVKGMAVDTRKAKTDYATDSGRLLVDKTYDFPVYFPDLAVLVMALKDYDEGTADDSLGYFSISLGSIETGEFKIQTLGLDGKPVPDSWIKVIVASSQLTITSRHFFTTMIHHMSPRSGFLILEGPSRCPPQGLGHRRINPGCLSLISRGRFAEGREDLIPCYFVAGFHLRDHI